MGETLSSRHTQQLILNAAVELFNARGTSQVSTNCIADACGVSRGNLHYHFRTKRELIQCILTRISCEMSWKWEEDLSHPTLFRLAEMFARQALLTHRYRFFYREQSELLRGDQLLLYRYRELVQHRVAALEEYFLELDRRSVLRFGPHRTLIRSIVRGTWILIDNWLNSVELLDGTLNLDAIQEGYGLILDIFRPYLTDERRAREESRLAIRAQIESFATRDRTVAQSSGVVGRHTADIGRDTRQARNCGEAPASRNS